LSKLTKSGFLTPSSALGSAAKECFPNLAGYSLEYLSKHLGIQLESGYFNSKLAHDASYDALFTYHLYRHLTHAQLKAQNVPNPFRQQQS
jgi:DNA polymerase III epsilon subunit-like protein